MDAEAPSHHRLPLLSPAFLARLERLDLAARRLLRGERRGERRSLRRGSGLEFSEHRPYVAGDDWRYVDWNAYSRLGELHCKQFHAEENLHLALCLDLSPSMDWGRHNKLAAALRLAAALGYVGLGRFDRVALLPRAAFSRGRKGLYAGKAARLGLLEDLASLETAPGAEPPARAAAELLSLFQGPALVVLLSDFYDASALAGPLGLLAARKHDVVALHLVDPDELDPPFRGPLRLTDAETGRHHALPLTDEAARAYRRRFREHLERTARLLARRSVRHLRVTTAASFDRTLHEVLRRGYLLRRLG